jgi:SM-20-related protein
MQNTLSQIQKLIDDIANNGYAICADFLPADIIEALAKQTQIMFDDGIMQPAKTGQHSNKVNANIRGDSTFWLHEDDNNANIQAYFKQMQLLKTALNRQLLVNVQSLESHLAYYPAGSRYTKHLDQFNLGAGVQNRQLSSVLYLNTNWQVQDGGELRLYLNEHEYLDISPIGGTLVLFLSNQFWHEVLPAKAHRISLAGWFKTQSNVLV